MKAKTILVGGVRWLFAEIVQKQHFIVLKKISKMSCIEFSFLNPTFSKDMEAVYPFE
jgi:hypothetical protein